MPNEIARLWTGRPTVPNPTSPSTWPTRSCPRKRAPSNADSPSVPPSIRKRCALGNPRASMTMKARGWSATSAADELQPRCCCKDLVCCRRAVHDENLRVLNPRCDLRRRAQVFADRQLGSRSRHELVRFVQLEVFGVVFALHRGKAPLENRDRHE